MHNESHEPILKSANTSQIIVTGTSRYFEDACPALRGLLFTNEPYRVVTGHTISGLLLIWYSDVSAGDLYANQDIQTQALTLVHKHDPPRIPAHPMSAKKILSDVLSSWCSKQFALFHRLDEETSSRSDRQNASNLTLWCARCDRLSWSLIYGTGIQSATGYPM